MKKTIRYYSGIILMLFLFGILLFDIKSSNFDVSKLNVNNETNIIKELSSQKYQGRLAGTMGNQEALQYIESDFRKIGIEPGGENGTYYQQFSSMVPMNSSQPYFIVSDRDGKQIKSYAMGRDYIENLDGYGGNGTAAGKLFYIKDMISNYKPEVIKDKIIITDVALGDSDIEFGIDHGIRGIVSLAPDGLRRTIIKIENKSGKTIPYYYFKNDKFDELMKLANQQVTISAKLDKTFKYVKTPNILGKIQGSKKDAGYVIFSAHMDSFGEEPGSKLYYPGAMDGLSGSSILLELARVMKLQSNKPDKTIVFVLWNNEEYGMKGKEYYLENPLYPLNKTDLVYINDIGVKVDPLVEFGYKGQAGQVLRDKIAQYTRLFNKQTDASLLNGFAENGVGALTIEENQMPSFSGFGEIIRNEGTGNDTLDNLDNRELVGATNMLLSYAKRDIYGDTFGGILTPGEIGMLGFLLLCIFSSYVVNTLASVNPRLKIFKLTMEDLYYSSVYRLFDKLKGYVLQGGLILVLIVFVTHIPNTFNVLNINGNIKMNFSWNQVLIGTVDYLRTLFTSGFGKSLDGVNVSEYIQNSFFKSFWLLASVLIVGTIFGTAKGIFDAHKEDKNNLRTVGTIMVFSLPDVFVVLLIQLLLIYIYNHNIFQFPREYRDQKQFIEAFLSLILLPSIYITRIAALATHEEKRKEYVKAAKAKGLSDFEILKKHILVGVFIKVIDSLPSILSLVISNLIIVDFLSGYNSIVSIMLACYKSGDVNSYTGLALCICFLYIFFVLIARIISKLINPLKRREI